MEEKERNMTIEDAKLAKHIHYNKDFHYQIISHLNSLNISKNVMVNPSQIF